MRKPLSRLALAAVVAAGLMGCAERDHYPTATVEPVRPVAVQPVAPAPAPMLNQMDGQVVRIDNDAYVIRDMSGRETRVFYDRTTMLDSIAPGDFVTVQYDGNRATSITRRAALQPAPTSAVVLGDTLPRPQTIDGVVHHQFGNEYEIKDISGREVRVWTDSATNRDGNITVGDRVLAHVSPMPSPYYVYRAGNPNVFEGQVVRIDDEKYIIRDSAGREMRIRQDDLRRHNSFIQVGDRVVVLPGRTSDEPPYTAYRYGDPYITQGQIVRMDGNCYIVRDLSGRETCLATTSTWYDPVVVGDRVIAYGNPSGALHADSLTKR